MNTDPTVPVVDPLETLVAKVTQMHACSSTLLEHTRLFDGLRRVCEQRATAGQQPRLLVGMPDSDTVMAVPLDGMSEERLAQVMPALIDMTRTSASAIADLAGKLYLETYEVLRLLGQRDADQKLLMDRKGTPPAVIQVEETKGGQEGDQKASEGACKTHDCPGQAAVAT